MFKWAIFDINPAKNIKNTISRFYCYKMLKHSSYCNLMLEIILKKAQFINCASLFYQEKNQFFEIIWKHEINTEDFVNKTALLVICYFIIKSSRHYFFLSGNRKLIKPLLRQKILKKDFLRNLLWSLHRQILSIYNQSRTTFH